MARTGRSRTRAQRFEDLPAKADHALVHSPLTETQIEVLVDWAKSSAEDQQSLSDLVEFQPIPMNAASWHEHLSVSPQLRETIGVTGKLSRHDVFAVARSAQSTKNWLPLLNASFAWGQGKNGYGPSRLTKIYDGAGQRGVDLNRILGDAVVAMGEGTAVDGYRQLRGKVPWLGPAFFTKFLYFASSVAPPSTGPAPLILDAVVAGQVRELAAARAVEVPGLQNNPAEARALATWLWSKGGWSAYRYGIWLEFAEAATERLRETSKSNWPVRSDLFELAVFNKVLHP